MSEKITLLGALRWMRDQFANWLASVTVFSFLWLAVGVAVAVLFVWDGVWSRHQAPSNLDPLTFQGAGWVMRLWTVFALAGAVWCFRHGARIPGAVMAFTWVLTSLMTYGHALGFIATGQQERYATASAVVNVEQVAVSSGTDQIAALEAQKATIREDRDTEMNRLAALISEVQTNRVASDDHLAEVYANESAAVSAAARDRLAAIDAAIMTVHTTKQDARTTGATEVATVIKFDPLYILLAEWTDGKPGVPEDQYVRKIAQGIGAFWAALLEMIGGAGPALLYAIHAHAADRKKAPEVTYSEDVPDGHVRWEGTPEEWDEIEKALQVHRNIKTGNKKGARTKRLGNKIEAGDRYYLDKISEFMTDHNKGMSTVDIARKYGMSVAQMRASYAAYMEPQEIAALFGAPVPDTDEPPMSETQPETDTDETDKEYPVDFPRNDKPNGADHDIPNQ